MTHLSLSLPSSHLHQALAILLTLLACSLARIYFILPQRWRRTIEHRSNDARRSRVKHGEDRQTCSVAVVLGSGEVEWARTAVALQLLTSFTPTLFQLDTGGHTTELIRLLSALPADRYTPRTYLISSGDRFSADKARAHEASLSASSPSSSSPESERDDDEYEIITLPRARAVHQSFWTTPFSLARSLAACFKLIALDPIVLRRTYKQGAAHRKQDEKSARVFADLILMNGPGTCVPVVLAVYILRVSALCFSPFLSPTNTNADGHRSSLPLSLHYSL